MATHEVEEDFDTKDPAHLEEEKVAGAIKTDFILSAEIMTIALAAIPKARSGWRRSRWPWSASVITVAVYGAVALIVKMDDIGLHMAAAGRLAPTRALGRGLVLGMPKLMDLPVHRRHGGDAVGRRLHPDPWAEAARLGLARPSDRGYAAEAVAHLVPAIAGRLHWLVAAAIDGVIGAGSGLGADPDGDAADRPAVATDDRTGKGRALSPADEAAHALAGDPQALTIWSADPPICRQPDRTPGFAPKRPRSALDHGHHFAAVWHPAAVLHRKGRAAGSDRVQPHDRLARPVERGRRHRPKQRLSHHAELLTPAGFHPGPAGRAAPRPRSSLNELA